MKKLVLFIFLSLMSLTALAKGPGLNVEKLFDGSYNSKPGVSMYISQNLGKYFRGCTVEGNAEMVKTATRLFEKDLPRAASMQDLTGEDGRYRSMRIVNNGEEIYVGLSYHGTDGCYLFINGPIKAFK